MSTQKFDQEIELLLTTDTEEFLVKFDLSVDNEVDVLEVCAGKHEILELLDDTIIFDIENRIINALKKQDESDYIDFMVA